MKAKLTFNLPDDKEEFNMAINASNYFSLLFEYDQWLRGIIKYSPDSMSEEKYDTYMECRQKLHEKLIEYNISL